MPESPEKKDSTPDGNDALIVGLTQARRTDTAENIVLLQKKPAVKPSWFSRVLWLVLLAFILAILLASR